MDTYDEHATVKGVPRYEFLRDAKMQSCSNAE